MKIKSQNPTKTTMDDVSNLADLSQKRRLKRLKPDKKKVTINRRNLLFKGNRNFRKSSKKVLKCGN